LKEVNSQSDRGAAIVAAAVIEELVEQVILERFVKCFRRIGVNRYSTE
jgi:hypothetical protein